MELPGVEVVNYNEEPNLLQWYKQEAAREAGSPVLHFPSGMALRGGQKSQRSGAENCLSAQGALNKRLLLLCGPGGKKEEGLDVETTEQCLSFPLLHNEGV